MRKNTIHEAAFRLAFDVKTIIAAEVRKLDIKLTPMQMRALRVIWRKANATSQDIASVLKRDKGQITRLINGLCDQNFVERTLNPKDNRSKSLRLTKAGEQIFRKVENIEEKLLDEMTKGIAETDLDVFFNVANKLSENMKQIN